VVTTAVNGEFVAAGVRPRTRLADGDRVEVLAPMQGADAAGLRNVLAIAAAARHGALPSPAVLTEAVRAARAEVVTVALRRESGGERAGQGFWSIIRELGVRVLPTPRAAIR